jgi:exodeoxyribonuclease V alpha subunit
MNEIIQGILPIDVESVSRVGASTHARSAYKGVQNKGPASSDLFHDKDDPARRDGSITGIVSKIRHSNPENGFHILRVKLDESGATVSFVGPCEPVSEGDRVEAVGRWERHARFGQQLKARFIRTMVPSSGDEIFAFLKGGGIKGVGVKTAEKLRDHFGDRLSEVMTSPTTMMAAKVSEKHAKLIADAWVRRSTHTEILAFLQSLSIGPATADKIIKKYGERTRQQIISNPYRIAKEIPGLGFKTADQMALAIGFERKDTRRIDACIMHVMNQIGRDGHCACTRQRILTEVRKLLSIDDRDIRAGVVRLVDGKMLIEEENGGSQVIYEAGVLKCEEEIATRIVARIAPIPLPEDINEAIAKAATDVGISSIHEHQALAVKTSLASRFSVITGGPGSGKTSSLEVMLRVFENLNPKAVISLCAPTGRAAQRMAESTGREASTIHRLLEWAPDRGGFQRGEENPLDADFVVADEASMLDIWLMRDLLRAVREDAVIVLVGDVDQLPSVGAGRVLGDVIESGVIPVTRLTRIFRQGAGSQIAETAQQINAGRMPRVGPPSKSTDMWAAWDTEPEDSVPRIARMVSEVAPQLGYDPLTDVQVLTAGHKGVLGTINLNLILQEALNPASPHTPEIMINDKVFRKGDRVIQLANNYDLDVFNGDIGQVIEITTSSRRKEAGRIRVLFEDKEIEFSSGEARQLSLAYAISVHKSQGSEFPVVIFVPTMQNYMMLKKTLIYTAVTRAKKLCALIGNERAAKTAVRNSDKGRVTGLAKRLAIENAELTRMTGV